MGTNLGPQLFLSKTNATWEMADLFVTALSGHCPRGMYSFPKLPVSSNSSPRYSLVWGWLQGFLTEHGQQILQWEINNKTVYVFYWRQTMHILEKCFKEVKNCFCVLIIWDFILLSSLRLFVSELIRYEMSPVEYSHDYCEYWMISHGMNGKVCLKLLGVGGIEWKSKI